MMSADPDLALELRECVRGVRELWIAVQAEARANLEADRDLLRSLRNTLTEETPV